MLAAMSRLTVVSPGPFANPTMSVETGTAFVSQFAMQLKLSAPVPIQLTVVVWACARPQANHRHAAAQKELNLLENTPRSNTIELQLQRDFFDSPSIFTIR